MNKAELIPMAPVIQDQIRAWLSLDGRIQFERAVKNAMDANKIAAVEHVAQSDQYTTGEFEANKSMTQAIEYRNFLRTFEKVTNPEFVFSEIQITSV